MIFSYKPLFGAEKEIYELISDITISMKSVDFLQMPKCLINEVPVSLSVNEHLIYDGLEKKWLLN